MEGETYTVAALKDEMELLWRHNVGWIPAFCFGLPLFHLPQSVVNAFWVKATSAGNQPKTNTRPATAVIEVIEVAVAKGYNVVGAQRC